MGISTRTRQAYSEIDEFLSLLKYEEINKIPKQLRDLFKEEKDVDYKKNIDPNKPISEQDLLEETLAIIALLNLKYWCEDEKEKERLIEIYDKNEKFFSELFQLGFDQDTIFKNKVKTIEEDVKKEQLLDPHKESLITKILRKIKSIFKK